MDMDRKLIGRLVEREIERHTTWSHFAATSGVSRATLHRIQQGDPAVLISTLRKVETGLSLPFDSLTAVGLHDWRTLAQMGLARELIEWLQAGVKKWPATNAPNTSTKRSQRESGPATV